MAWQDYLKMSARQRRSLALKAHRGDKGAQSALLEYTRDIKKEVNKRLADLEKSNLAYGKAYNNVTYFTETQYGTHRFKSPTSLGYDWYDMSLQNDIGYKFLNNMTSTREGARQAEQHRVARLKELEVLPNNLAKRKEKEFLKFLGNEAISAAMDEYGTSTEVVEMMYDAYQQNGTKALTVMRGAMTEFLAGRTDFDTAMGRVGIKVEDYYRKRPTS